MTFEGPGPGWDLKGLLWGTILYFFGGLQKKEGYKLDFYCVIEKKNNRVGKSMRKHWNEWLCKILVETRLVETIRFDKPYQG